MRRQDLTILDLRSIWDCSHRAQSWDRQSNFIVSRLVADLLEAVRQDVRH